MGVLVDSSVLIDVFRNDTHWYAWSIETVRRVAHSDELWLNQIIAAETRWVRSEDHPLLFRLVQRLDLPWEAAARAGEAHFAYRRRQGTRDAILADFLIGAHAAVAGLALLTRDPRRIRAAFPEVRLITPETDPL